MKETYQCEICKNYHNTPEAANECEGSHLLPVSVKARSYGPNYQAPEKVEVLFDNKRGGHYGAMYKFLSWLDKDEENDGKFHEFAQNLVTTQLREENASLRETVEENNSYADTLKEVIRKQADEIAELKTSDSTSSGYECETFGKYEYTIMLGSRDIAFNGSFTVNADSYDEARENACEVFYSCVKMPGSLKMDLEDSDFEVVKTNAGEIFEKELDKALNDYSSRSIDLVYDEESGEFCITHHSLKDSFKIFGIPEENFIFENDIDPEDWVRELADKHTIGYCL